MKYVIGQRIVLALTFVVSIFIGCMWQIDAQASISKDTESDKATKVMVNDSYSKLPLYFIQNDGQMDEKVKYYEKGNGHNTFFTKEGVYLELINGQDKASELKKAEVNITPEDRIKKDKSEIIKLKPLDANKDPKIVVEGIQKRQSQLFNRQ